jgi:hypothetical protein
MRRLTPTRLAILATVCTSRCPPTPPANRIGRDHAAPSANIKSASRAHRGNAKNSGAQTIVRRPARMRYPQVGWLVWTTGRYSTHTPSLRKLPACGTRPFRAADFRIAPHHSLDTPTPQDEVR